MTKAKAAKGLLKMNDNVWLTFLGRLFQIFGIPIVIGLTIWGVGLISDLKTSVAKMETKLDIIAADPYHGVDARRDFALRDAMIKFNTDRYQDLSSRVDALEAGSARRGQH